MKYGNRACMETATTGTGAATLGAAVVKHQTFANAGIQDGDTVPYVIEEGNDWEMGTGVYIASGPTLTRALLESSTGSLLSLSGGAIVFVDVPASVFNEIGIAENVAYDNAASGLTATDVQDAVDEVYSRGKTAAIEFVIDGGGLTITTGMKGYLEIPFACTINRWTLLGDQSGSIVVDVFKCDYASFDPPTKPASGNKITASAPPTISTAKKAQSSTLTGWTTAVAAGDILAFNVNSVTTMQRATLSLKFAR